MSKRAGPDDLSANDAGTGSGGPWTLQLVVTIVFVLIVVTITGGLIAFSHREVSSIAKLEATADFDSIADEVRNEVGERLDLISVFLETAALTVDTTAPAPQLIPLLASMLERLTAMVPAASAFYAGATDGRFVLVQNLKAGAPTAIAGRIPGHAVYAAQTISAPNAPEEWALLDGRLAEITHFGQATTGFDPRSRRWYTSARGSRSAVITPVYRFANIAAVGVTLARQSHQAAGAVLGVDMTLADLHALLAELRTSPSMELFIFDSEGASGAVASGAALPDFYTSRDVEGPARAAEGPPLLRALYHAYESSPGVRDTTVSVDGRTYLARFEPASRQLRELVIAIAYPQDLIVAPADRVSRALLSVGAVAIVAGLLFVFLAARVVAHPLQDVTLAMGRIMHLDFGRLALPASRIVEIRALAAALEGVRSALATFARYVPVQLVQNVVLRSVTPELGGVRQPITVLFSDVVGFTAMAETLAPEALMAKVTRYFSAIGEELLRTDATIDKYIGDAVMAFWNAPSPQANHERLACLGALRASRRIDRLNTAFASEGLAPMATRFGVHRGDVVVGNVGSVDRMNYTALGHTVNLASRLEGLNTSYGTTILISDAVKLGAGAGFTFRFVDRIAPYGAREPLSLYELLGATIPGEPELEADPAALDALPDWERACGCYRARDWVRARQVLVELCARHPGESLFALYQARVARFELTPPPLDWDGAERPETK